MASAIDSGVDTGNDSNDSCVQDKASNMEVDQPQPNTSSCINKDSSSDKSKDAKSEILKNCHARISFVHLPSTLRHGYEVTPVLQQTGPNGEYKNKILLKKMKTITCRMRTSPCTHMSHQRIHSMRKKLEDAGCISVTSNHSKTCIHADPIRMCRAACVNNIDAVKEMLAKGLSPNCQDCFQRTPLHIAACMGYKEIVELLLLHGADPNAKDRIGNTPLHLAACTNHIEVINLLLKAGTNVMEKDMAGHMPLHFAITKFNIMSKSQGFVQKQDLRKVITMLAEYMKGKDTSKVDNELLVKFENLLLKSKSNEPEDASISLDSGVRDLLNNLSSLSLSNN